MKPVDKAEVERIVQHAEPEHLWPVVADRLLDLAAMIGKEARAEIERGVHGPKAVIAHRLIRAVDALHDWVDIAYR